MWGRLAVAALLCSVALPAEAAPVVTFVSAIVGSISAAFAAGGVFAGGTLAGLRSAQPAV